MEILIAHKLCVFSSDGKKVINPPIRISTSGISHEIRPDERSLHKYHSCLLILMEAKLSFDLMVLPFEHIEFTKTFGRKYNSSKNILTNKIENLFICQKLNTINQSRDRENLLETEKYFPG